MRRTSGCSRRRCGADRPTPLDAVRRRANTSDVPVRLRLVAVAVAAAATLAAPGSAARNHAAASLSARLAAALAVRGTDAGRSGAVAVDLRTGDIVFARNPTKPLAPASVEKLSVTYAALVALGPTFRFRTQVLGRGAQSGKTWRGDLVLRGYGDPTLSSRRLRALAGRVRSLGVRTVAGSRPCSR